MKLSATIIAQDEERALPDCLASVKGLCDEILVIDGGSKDRTREVAARAGARVLERPFDDYARQHEFARTEAKGDWILSIDADERASAEISRFPQAPHAAFSLPFKNHFRGVWLRHGGFWPDRHVRLFRRDACRYDPGRAIHERLLVEGSIGQLQAPILHYTYDSLADCLQKMQRYGERAATMLHERGVRAGPAQVALRPLWRFVRGYLLKGGFLDGGPGAAMAWARAFEAYCRYARLWELSRFSPADGDRIG
ncbi:MAG TPA: glycosyltransferase family 2 protein [Myxococcales bacterium]|nr:glycosyltransferase family 2 protein [Myxococcales bacterium]